MADNTDWDVEAFTMLTKRQALNLSFVLSLRMMGFTYEEIMDAVLYHQYQESQ
jgi:hypothetical protein